MSMDKPSTDITYARPVTRPAWEPWDIHRWASVAGVYLSAAALILLAVTSWRTVDATLNRDADFIRQQREFNQGLVAAIEDLADKTGILTSADFCPVRFRLRFPGGGAPAKLMSATLTRLSSDGDDPVGDLSSMDSGVIDFGLHPPGRYRLQVRSPDGMSLVHEFDLLPGVPMDRVVICPSGALPEESRNVVQIDVNWPPELASDNVAALIEVLPGPFESQEWRWEPTRDVPPLYAVATTNGDAEWLLRRFDARGFDAESLSSVDPAAAARVPYRYCRLGSITFMHGSLDSRSQETWHVLGTHVYGASEGDAVANHPLWRSASNPPLLECDPSGLSHWTIEIPPECVPELLQRIRESAQTRDEPDMAIPQSPLAAKRAWSYTIDTPDHSMPRILPASFLMLTQATPILAEDGSAADSSRDTDDSDAMWDHLTARIATYSWSAEDSEAPSFELRTDPLLRYTDPVREFLAGGQLHLVLDGERPVAACSIWLNIHKGATVRELTTLSDEVLVCRNANGDVVWRPRPAELLYVPLEDAGAPAPTAPRRLAQMRSSARRFSATFFRRADGDPSDLRLLPQPIYRFTDAGHGITDAALFAFVQSTDPDLLLMIAARTDQDSGEQAWTWSLARINSGHVRVRLDDVELHEYRDYWTNPRTQEDQYVEADDLKYSQP